MHYIFFFINLLFLFYSRNFCIAIKISHQRLYCLPINTKGKTRRTNILKRKGKNERNERKNAQNKKINLALVYTNSMLNKTKIRRAQYGSATQREREKSLLAQKLSLKSVKVYIEVNTRSTFTHFHLWQWQSKFNNQLYLKFWPFQLHTDESGRDNIKMKKKYSKKSLKKPIFSSI